MRLHQKQRFEIQTFMHTILDVSGEYVVYKDDWSDGKVGEKFNVAATTIAGTRAETFGRLRSHSYAPKALGALTERVERLERQVESLGGNPIEQREGKYNGEDHHAS